MHGATILGCGLSAECERIVRRFEEAWGGPEVPELDSFLLTVGPASPRLLVELVHVDLDFRLRRGEPARVEDYLHRHPLLERDWVALLERIVAEYALRRHWQGAPTLEEYQVRFPDYAEELRNRVAGEPALSGWLDSSPIPPPIAWARPSFPGYEILGEL